MYYGMRYIKLGVLISNHVALFIENYLGSYNAVLAFVVMLGLNLVYG